MKKNIIIATLVAASALLASISCTKQDDVQSVSEAKVFTATIEQDLTKTMLKEGSVFWDEKDLININGARYSATPNRDTPESATFTFVDGIAPTAPYCAIYPASLWDNGKYFFPSVQNYSEGKFNAPMYAQSSSEKLIFNNICGVICLKLRSSDNSETVVRRIVLTTKGEKVWGDFKVNTNVEEKWEASVVNEGDQSNTVTLDCGEDGISLNPDYATEFFIYLPPQNYQSGMTVSIVSTNSNCSAYEMHTNYEVSVECNSVYSFNWTVQFVHYVLRDEAPAGGLSHLFTVGPNETDKVYFSKANLVATHSNSDNYEFNFAEEQYTFIGKNEGNAKLFNNSSLTSGDEVDLFSWSTSSNQYGINNFEYESEAEGDFYDWGKGVYPYNTWRTLSRDEWIYLFNTREVNGGTGPNYSYKGVKDFMVDNESFSGIFIFPDDFTGTFAPQSWGEINNAGIVFLPLAGYVMENSGRSFYEETRAYWSATSFSNGSQIYPGAVLYENDVNLNYYANDIRNRGSVRLVANAYVPASAPEEIVIESK